MAEFMQVDIQDVTIGDDWSGGTLVTLPRGCKGCSIQLPIGSSSLELGVRPLTYAGAALGLSGSSGGVGQWTMKFEDGKLGSAMTLDLRHSGTGDLVGVVWIWS